MRLSKESLKALENLAKGTRFMLRGDMTHGFEIRYDPVNARRSDKTCRSLPKMKRAGWIEFATPPLNHHRYYNVKLTPAGTEILNIHKENPMH